MPSTALARGRVRIWALGCMVTDVVQRQAEAVLVMDQALDHPAEDHGHWHLLALAVTDHAR